LRGTGGKMGYSEKCDGYTIKSCGTEDVDDIRQFLHNFWAKDHILYIDKDYLDWQYFNKRHGSYNFLIARDDISSEVLGIVGFIPNYIYDYSINDEDKFIFVTTWMVSPDAKGQSGIGIKLLTSISKYEDTKTIATTGNYDTVVPLYKMMKFSTGTLGHFYILNSEISDFQIAKVPNGYDINKGTCDNTATIDAIGQDCFSDYFSAVMKKDKIVFPKKTKDYFINRYFKHPIYNYKALSIKTENEPQAIFIIRKVNHKAAAVLRIIDAFGDFSNVKGIYTQIQKLLIEYSSEYIDLYCTGIDPALLSDMGFTNNAIESELIIPNFFEPFEQINRKVNFAFLNEQNKSFRFFKGDGDQDRPNIYHKR